MALLLLWLFSSSTDEAMSHKIGVQKLAEEDEMDSFARYESIGRKEQVKVQGGPVMVKERWDGTLTTTNDPFTQELERTCNLGRRSDDLNLQPAQNGGNGVFQRPSDRSLGPPSRWCRS